MRIAELSRSTGVPAATIKYYLREGLLPPGVRLHANQVDYDTEHVRRLRLIRALVDIGGLSIADAARVLEILDARQHSMRDAIGKVQYALGGPGSAPQNDSVGSADLAAPADGALAHADAENLLARLGWEVYPKSPALRTLTEVCATLRRLGHTEVVDVLDEYAAAAERAATIDVDLLTREPDLERSAETAVVATVLGDVLLSALRRLAQEHLSRDRLT